MSVVYLDLDATSVSNSTFNGILKVSGTCLVSGSPQGINNACTKITPSETTSPTVTSISLASTFVGAVTSDSKNSTGATGTSLFSGISGSDWLNFENRFRGWGKQGTFPGTTIAGNCSSSTCQIWDWSLKTTDTVARNVNACPDKNIVDTHQWSASAANQAFCDANYKGSSLSGGSCITTFLRNAVEIFGDGIGNENGICESNEECLFTPNIGAYQGHSSDSTNSSKLIPASQSTTSTITCQDITTGGTISNVKLWKFDTNGY